MKDNPKVNRNYAFNKMVGVAAVLLSIVIVAILLTPRDVQSTSPMLDNPMETPTTIGPDQTVVPGPVQTTIAGPTETAAAPTPSSEPILPYVVREGSFETWNYTAKWVMDGEYYAAIRYDTSTIAAIKAYAAENKLLAATLVNLTGTVQLKVTFNTTLEPDQYRSWVAQSGFTPTMAELRFVEDDGTRGSGGVAPQGTEVLPASSLDLSTFADKNPVMKGVYAVLGTVPADRLAGILADPLVFLPDVTPAIVRRELEPIVGTGEFNLSSGLDTPFWQMEDFGLQNFQP